MSRRSSNILKSLSLSSVNKEDGELSTMRRSAKFTRRLSNSSMNHENSNDQKQYISNRRSSFTTTNNAHLNKVAVTNILRIAASAEHGSDHPFSRGITKKAAEFETPLSQVDNFINEAGAGIKCQIGGKWVSIGNRRCLK